MSDRGSRRPILALLAAFILLVGTVPVVTAADPSDFKATGLTPSGRISGFKSASADLAKSDRALLARTDAERISVMIKLDYDGAASYAGGIKGLAATSPRVTGKSLTGKSAAEVKYRGYVAKAEAAFSKALKAAVPSARIGQSFQTVYGGVSATIPANRAKDLLRIDGVVAVQVDHLNQLLTDSSPDFIGASPLYGGLGGAPNAGSGVIYGNLDTGVWPEHPSFADLGNLGAPPGPARRCNFGDNPLTPAIDPFVCNDKLIGGHPFLATYLSNPTRAAAEPYHTARDSNGHGTHTSSTSAGNVLASAVVLGTERGPINGIAPGAWVMEYKVCGIQGCFDSDTSAAVQQAILDGVDVINFSISGGTDPFTDPTELAFLDAYAAGVFVSASAGNEGPGASTANHLSPWVTTVAASTQTREFASTLTVTGGGAPFVTEGASITGGAGPLPVVRASDAPYSNNLCTAPAAPGTFTGKIVACQRGVNARVDKGFNVLQGGAAGMILFNAVLADTETDNHWLPTVHLADGTAFVAYLAANPGATASFTGGVSQDGQGDVMAAFSSRGPAGLFIKPDVTAPGVQILAGMTPTPESITEGPPGQYFQAIAGTSMSSPHVAGAALLLRDAHPSWTPGQVKSALMTTATTDVVKEDLTTDADPFDFGSGRIVVNGASAAKITFDETATNYAAMGGDPLTAIHLNVPSVNAPVMPGEIFTTRTAKNVTGSKQQYNVSSVSPAGSTINVTPKKLTLNAGQSKAIEITITSDAPIGTQQFGEIVLSQSGPGGQTLHLPVAFIHTQGVVTLSQSCTPASVARNATTSCDVVATDTGFDSQVVDLQSTTNSRIDIVGATGATLGTDSASVTGVTLDGAASGIPSVAPGVSPAGYLPLSLFGITPVAIGDEDILNFNVPAFSYNGVSYNTIGVDSNGYAIAGGGTSEDNNCCSLPAGPDPAPPNNLIAPFWTDLDGTGNPGIFAAVLTDGVNSWLVIEWQVDIFGTSSDERFQVWIGVDGFQDVTMTYDPANLPGNPVGQDFLVGAENDLGQGDMESVLPTGDLRVTSTAPTPGESVTYNLTVQGMSVGTGVLTTSMTADGVLGTTIVKTNVPVTP
jgi:hypothetical protein